MYVLSTSLATNFYAILGHYSFFTSYIIHAVKLAKLLNQCILQFTRVSNNIIHDVMRYIKIVRYRLGRSIILIWKPWVCTAMALLSLSPLCFASQTEVDVCRASMNRHVKRFYSARFWFVLSMLYLARAGVDSGTICTGVVELRGGLLADAKIEGNASVLPNSTRMDSSASNFTTRCCYIEDLSTGSVSPRKLVPPQHTFQQDSFLTAPLQSPSAMFFDEAIHWLQFTDFYKNSSVTKFFCCNTSHLDELNNIEIHSYFSATSVQLGYGTVMVVAITFLMFVLCSRMWCIQQTRYKPHHCQVCIHNH